jgi:hypothetical protein
MFLYAAQYSATAITQSYGSRYLHTRECAVARSMSPRLGLRFSLDVLDHVEVMSTWLPIFPINEDRKNERNGVGEPGVYNLGLDEFFEWFGREPRAGFTKATVSAWRVALEARGLGSISINVRITAVRKLAVEAADNGLLAQELAAGIARIKRRQI